MTPSPTLETLRAACAERFREPEYAYRADADTGTLWISRVGSHHEVGLQPHTVARRGLEASLESMAAKLAR